jgi:hypothetical protein
MKTILFAVAAFLMSFCTASALNAQAQLDLESGLLFTGYNDVQIPGKQGTRFSMKDDLKSETAFFYRLRMGYTLDARHSFSVLYAPLETRYTGIINRDIAFQGVVFPANSDLTGTYKFNSYRFTYRYDIIKKPGFEFGLGFTAKIRDAKIKLASATLSSEKANVGFVPIVNFRLCWKMNDNLGLLLEGDALAAPQGRAEDVLLAATYKLSDKYRIRAGYRILEGGADGASVYGFALFHYASFGLTYTFMKNGRTNKE